MSELDDFLGDVLPRHKAAAEAFHAGDPGPRAAMWSRRDPVTLLGAFGVSARGWDEVGAAFRRIASRFSRSAHHRSELVAAGASGDLAYTVSLEHSEVSIDGGEPGPSTVRLTQVYPREDGEWKIVHRHGDVAPPDRSPTAGS